MDKGKEKTSRNIGGIGKIQHYYLVMVSFRSDNIPERVNYKKLKQFVEGWLNSIDPQNIKARNGISYREDELWLELALMPERSLEKSSIIGPSIPPARWITPKQLKSVIEKKIQKYKSIKKQNAAYVVAVCLHQDALVDEDEAIEVLFGKEKWTVDVVKKEIVDVKRDFSGLLTPKPGLGGMVRNTRLSALLVIRSNWQQPKDDGGEHRAHFIRVLHNPNADIPLGSELFKGYPQLLRASESEKYVSLKWVDKEADKSFGLLDS